MQLLELTLPTAAENVAFDEALLDEAEASALDNAGEDRHCEKHAADLNCFPELLRLWEPAAPLVVIGRSSPIKAEVDLPFCNSAGIPVIRRCSGGQSIVTGPGCLMYAVLLSYASHPELRMLEQAHLYVMSRMQRAIESLGLQVAIAGTSDLTLAGQKFSGNSLRCKRNYLIYHGTMICDFSIDTISRCLGKPIREPAYRANRDHDQFLTQLPVSTQRLATAIKSTWQAIEPFKLDIASRTDRLVREKYSQRAWNEKV